MQLYVSSGCTNHMPAVTQPYIFAVLNTSNPLSTNSYQFILPRRMNGLFGHFMPQLYIELSPPLRELSDFGHFDTRQTDQWLSIYFRLLISLSSRWIICSAETRLSHGQSNIWWSLVDRTTDTRWTRRRFVSSLKSSHPTTPMNRECSSNSWPDRHGSLSEVRFS